MGRDIAGTARIAIVAPSAAEVGFLLDDQKRGLTGLPKADGKTQTAESAADDQDIDVTRNGVALRLGSVRLRHRRPDMQTNMPPISELCCRNSKARICYGRQPVA